jgi:hypothetical protein
MTLRRRMVTLGTAAGAGAAALAILAGPQASAATETVQGYSGSFGFNIGDVTHQEFATQCDNTFSGPVTSGGGSGSVVASIDKFTVDHCDQGVSVTVNALPWTFEGQNVNNGGFFTVKGIDLNITTAKGTCRYTGTATGGQEFPPTTYDFRGTLTRQSGGCGGDEQILFDAPTESVFISGS